MAPRSSHRRSNLLFCVSLVLVLVVGLSGCDKPKNWTGTPVKVLVVLNEMTKQPNCPTLEACAPSFTKEIIDIVLPPRHNAPDYLAMLDEEINSYYQKATYGQMYFDFELLPGATRADGWWDSPYSMEEVNKASMDFKQIAMDIAYSALGADLANYERVIIISNFQSRGGQTCCLNAPTPYYAVPGNWTTGSGTTPMIVAMVNEGSTDQELITVAAHELGHSIGAPDHYYDGGVGMGDWDLMDNDWAYFHFGAWTKLDRGWISWTGNTTRMPCDSGSCEITTILDPEEKQGNNALLIPLFGTSEFTGLMVECRKPINGDEGIPEEGVLVTFSNPYNLKYLAKTVSEVRSNKTNKYSLLQPGEVFYDVRYKVRVINLSKPGDAACTVKAQREIPPSLDVYITQGSFVEGGPFDRYKSPDIWNDTGSNGLGIYPDYETTVEVGTINRGNVPIPTGYGDPYVILGYGDTNVIKYLVHNGGTVVARDIKVNVYLRQPLSVTVQPDDCGAPTDAYDIPTLTFPKLIGSTTIKELPPGQTFLVDSYLNNNADLTVKAPFEIEVEIEQLDGEDDITNNIAYETYIYPYGGIDAVDAMGATLSDKCLSAVPFMAMEFPDEEGVKCGDWDLVIEPSSGFLAPGETVNFNITGKPHEGVPAGETCEAQFGVFMPLTSVYTPVDSFGFTLRAVDPSSLTCSIPEGSSTSGTPVSVTGQLDPAKADTIGLVYTDPAGKQELRNLETQDNGNYGDAFTPTLLGTWGVQAFWVGDDKHAPTQSAMCRFTVKEEVEVVKEPPVFNPGKVANCREGPSIFWRSLGQTKIGSAYPIIGANLTNSWYYIQLSDTLKCWVKADTGEPSGDLSGVEMLVVKDITPTPTLIPTITPTAIPQVNCGVYTSADQCGMHPECEWNATYPSGPRCENK